MATENSIAALQLDLLTKVTGVDAAVAELRKLGASYGKSVVTPIKQAQDAKGRFTKVHKKETLSAIKHLDELGNAYKVATTRKSDLYRVEDGKLIKTGSETTKQTLKTKYQLNKEYYAALKRLQEEDVKRQRMMAGLHERALIGEEKKAKAKIALETKAAAATVEQQRKIEVAHEKGLQEELKSQQKTSAAKKKAVTDAYSAAKKMAGLQENAAKTNANKIITAERKKAIASGQAAAEGASKKKKYLLSHQHAAIESLQKIYKDDKKLQALAVEQYKKTLDKRREALTPKAYRKEVKSGLDAQLSNFKTGAFSKEAGFFDDYKRQTIKMSETWRAAGGQMEMSFHKAARSAMILTGAISSAIAGISLLVITAGKLERQMLMVSTMLDDNQHLLKSMTDSVERMAVTYGQSTEVISKGLYDILSAQIDVGASTGVLETALIGATAGFTDAATSTDALLTMLKSFKVEAKDSIDIMDILFTTVKKGRTTFAELAPVLGVVSASMGIAGISAEELGASIATMTQAGLRSRPAAVSLNAIIRGFIRPSKKSMEMAKKYGVTLSSTTLKAKGLSGVLSQLNDLTKVWGDSTGDILGQIFPQIRGFRGLAAALQNYNKYQDAMNAMQERGGETMKAYARAARGLQYNMQRIKSTIPVFLANLVNMSDEYGDLKNIVKKVADRFADFTMALRDPISPASRLVKKIKAITVNLGRLLIMALGLSVIKNVAMMVLQLARAFTILKLSMLPIIVLGLAVAAAIGYGIWASINKTTESLKEFDRNMKSQSATMELEISNVKELISVYTALANKTNKTAKETDALKSLIYELNSYFPGIGEELRSSVAGGFEAAAESVAHLNAEVEKLKALQVSQEIEDYKSALGAFEASTKGAASVLPSLKKNLAAAFGKIGKGDKEQKLFLDAINSAESYEDALEKIQIVYNSLSKSDWMDDVYSLGPKDVTTTMGSDAKQDIKDYMALRNRAGIQQKKLSEALQKDSVKDYVATKKAKEKVIADYRSRVEYLEEIKNSGVLNLWDVKTHRSMINMTEKAQAALIEFYDTAKFGTNSTYFLLAQDAAKKALAADKKKWLEDIKNTIKYSDEMEKIITESKKTIATANLTAAQKQIYDSNASYKKQIADLKSWLEQQQNLLATARDQENADLQTINQKKLEIEKRYQSASSILLQRKIEEIRAVTKTRTDMIKSMSDSVALSMANATGDKRTAALLKGTQAWSNLIAQIKNDFPKLAEALKDWDYTKEDIASAMKEIDEADRKAIENATGADKEMLIRMAKERREMAFLLNNQLKLIVHNAQKEISNLTKATIGIDAPSMLKGFVNNFGTMAIGPQLAGFYSDMEGVDEKNFKVNQESLYLTKKQLTETSLMRKGIDRLRTW